MENINDIIASLSDDDINMLKGVATSILGESTQEKSDIDTSSLGGLNLSQSELNMMLKAKTVIDRMNNSPSINADLINALKPHLSPESRDKADKAIRILKLFDILPYIKDLF